MAENDLSSLYDWLERGAGPAIAGGYIGRLEEACLSLEHFPRRGTRRDDLRRCLRIIGFERRATIAFQVKGRKVIIIRIFYGGQDFERFFQHVR